MKTLFIRTCQECGKVHESVTGPQPGDKVSRAYLDKKCARCKSEALDYGSFRNIPENEADQKLLDEEY